MDDSTLLVGALVVITSIWAGLDAQKLGAGKLKLGGLADTSPAGWFAGCLLLWIVVFPLYLITRPKLTSVGGGVSGEPEMKRCAACDRLYDAQYDGCPHCARQAPDSE